MKERILPKIILLSIMWASSYGQSQNSPDRNTTNAICLELFGTSTVPNLLYSYQSKFKNNNIFFRADAIVGYRYKIKGNHGIVHAYNFSTALNLGYLHKSGRSIFLGCGIGYDRGRVSLAVNNGPDKTNQSVVVYFRLNYSRRILHERLILGISLVYGQKLIEYYDGLDPYFNPNVEEFQNWLLPGFSIGCCFGKKYFQKDKIGSDPLH